MIRSFVVTGKGLSVYRSFVPSILPSSGSPVVLSSVSSSITNTVFSFSIPRSSQHTSSSSVRSSLLPSSYRFYSSSSVRYASPSSTATTPPVQFHGKTLDETLIRKIGEKDTSMRQAYDNVPTNYPDHAQPDDPVTGQITQPIDQHIAFRKRLLYRSKQRGWLEVDLLMGTWAEKYLSTLSETELYEYERILNSETIDLYNYITQRVAIPANLQDSKVLKMIQTFVSSAPLGRADPKAYEQIKKNMTN